MRTKREGKNIRYLRQKNRLLILSKLALAGETSRIELSGKVGLAKMSVSKIVADLIEEGFVEETGQSSSPKGSSAGRRRSCIRIVPGCITVLGVYISRNVIVVSLVDLSVGVVATKSEAVGRGGGKDWLTSTILRNARQIWQEAGVQSVRGIGVAAIGLIDRANGYILRTTDFLNIDNLNICGILGEEFNAPVFVENDMKSAAITEKMYGAGKLYSDFICLGISYGVGAGIIINNKLFEGSDGFSSEVGHMSVDMNGPLCSCSNNGCLELYASIPVLLAKAGCSSWPDLVEGARNGVVAAMQTLDDLVKPLTAALVSLANVFDPQAFILVHEIALAGDLLLPKLERRLNSAMFQRTAKEIKVLPSAIGNRLTSLCAASIVFDRIFMGVIPI